MGFIEDWQKFLSENYVWFIPVVATMTAPLVGAAANAFWDWLKMKKIV